MRIESDPSVWLEFEKTQLVPQVAYSFGEFMQSARIGGIGISPRNLLYGRVNDMMSGALDGDDKLIASLVAVEEPGAVERIDWEGDEYDTSDIVAECVARRAEKVFVELCEALGVR